MPIVAVEGYQLSEHFILKELFIQNSNEEFRQFLFKPPNGFKLSDKDARTVRYTTRHLSGLSYTLGDISYTEVGPILQKLQHCVVYTYGCNARNFLLKWLPSTVIINIQELGYSMPKELFKRPCFLNHPARYCAASKAFDIKCFLDNSNILN